MTRRIFEANLFHIKPWVIRTIDCDRLGTGFVWRFERETSSQFRLRVNGFPRQTAAKVLESFGK